MVSQRGWAFAPLHRSVILLLGVGDPSHKSPRYADSHKPRAGLWRRSQVLAVSLHSQQLWGECAQSLRRSGQRAPGSTEEGHRSTRHLCQSQCGCLTPEPVLSSLGMKIGPAWHRGSPDTAEILSGFINCRNLSPLLSKLAWKLQRELRGRDAVLKQVRMAHLILHGPVGRHCYYPHFADAQTDAQRS